ncbi:hypothetical protein CV102_03355 [Natronococcus pandeyae]|uniref:Halobacterial output domain-containing protein n=1 Tax=Natronococcus pandeyae TaxID=2055836 RepID=A0A8J8Q869_9EURY|nr:HalOD1 output domain-containing protein [Natronococcus pandeyae]TYL40618.1 hypothetical protein CV102_03355 [Natronococcus pandeyae]
MSTGFHDRPTDSAPDFPEAIVEEVAELEGVSPTELHPPLYSVIDTEALAQLFHTVDGEGCVTFEWVGYEITAHQGGQVTVFDPPREAERSVSEE